MAAVEDRDIEGPAPLVSVIMPAFNAADFLADAAASVLGQSLQNLELIIIDDGSTDDTAAVADRLASRDGRVRLLRHDRNQGSAVGRNTGLQAARGRWIAPVDADDEIGESRLDSLCQITKAHHADFVADNLQFEFIVEGQLLVEPAYEDDAQGVRRLTVEALIDSDMPRNGVCSFGYLKPLMRREFLENNGLCYDTTLHTSEDFHLYLRALVAGARFLFDPSVKYYFYRHTPESLTRDPQKQLDNLSDAIRGSRGLREFALAQGDSRTAALLREHLGRKMAVAWISRLKLAWQTRRFGTVLQLLLPGPQYRAGLWRHVLARAALLRRTRHNRSHHPLKR